MTKHQSHGNVSPPPQHHVISNTAGAAVSSAAAVARGTRGCSGGDSAAPPKGVHRTRLHVVDCRQHVLDAWDAPCDGVEDDARDGRVLRGVALRVEFREPFVEAHVRAAAHARSVRPPCRCGVWADQYWAFRCRGWRQKGVAVMFASMGAR